MSVVPKICAIALYQCDRWTDGRSRHAVAEWRVIAGLSVISGSGGTGLIVGFGMALSRRSGRKKEDEIRTM